MVDFKRGISAKDLRPFSVDDPLGQKQRRRVSVSSNALPANRSTEPANFGTVTVNPEQARKWGRLGCLLVMGIWTLSIVAGAAAWLPRFLDEIAPAIKALVTRLASEIERSRESAPGDGPAPPADADSPEPSLAPAPPATPATPNAPPASAVPDASEPATTELTRVCEKTVACCLVIQGERARSICENFRRMPTVEPCEEAYKVFTQVGRQMGRSCE